MDITELKRELAGKAQAVCEKLPPNGRAIRGEWEVGSTSGEPGKSLKVCLTGPKAGLWSDFAGSEGGDLIDLWCEFGNLKLVEALDEIRTWLGVERPQWEGRQERSWHRPQKPNCRAPEARVLDYLTEDRNIPANSPPSSGTLGLGCGYRERNTKLPKAQITAN